MLESSVPSIFLSHPLNYSLPVMAAELGAFDSSNFISSSCAIIFAWLKFLIVFDDSRR